MSNNQTNVISSEQDLAPRCIVCGTPLAGPLGRVFRLAGISRSSRNPNICSQCNTHIEEGLLAEISVLFADLCSFTEFTHKLGPERMHEIVDAFLKMATDALVKHDAFIDKYIGDAVMAFFNVPIQRDDHAQQAVAAAWEIQTGLAQLREQVDLDLNAGIGIATGWARLGSLGANFRKDYTILGDVVNLAARLEGQARPGEILVHGTVYEKIAADYPDACRELLSLKGFPEPVLSYRLCADIYADEPQHVQSKTEGRDPSPRMGLGTALLAILGAPCAAGMVVGPLATGLGIGTLFGAASAQWMTLDMPLYQYPLFALAVLGSLANLYTLWHAHTMRQRGEGGIIAMTQLERRRTLLVAGMSITTLIMVSSELYIHITHSM